MIIAMMGWMQLQGSESPSFDPVATLDLFDAIERKDIEGVQRSLSMGADPNGIYSDNSNTPLTLAAAWDFDQAIEILVKNGAIIDQSNADGWTPLVMAANYGKKFAMKALLDRRANVHARNSKNGSTPLITAAVNPDIIRMLLDAGADVNARDNYGYTDLIMRAIHADLYPQKSKDAMQLLLDAGADVNAKNIHGRTALDYINGSLAEKIDPILAELKDLLIQAARNAESLQLYLAGVKRETQVGDVMRNLLGHA